MSSTAGPSYDLETVRRLVEQGACDMSYAATDGMYALGLTSEDVWDVVRELRLEAFYKPMPAKKMPGSMQDVYYTHYQRGSKLLAIYLKLQIITQRQSGAQIVNIISFKRNERA